MKKVYTFVSICTIIENVYKKEPREGVLNNKEVKLMKDIIYKHVDSVIKELEDLSGSAIDYADAVSTIDTLKLMKRLVDEEGDLTNNMTNRFIEKLMYASYLMGKAESEQNAEEIVEAKNLMKDLVPSYKRYVKGV